MLWGFRTASLLTQGTMCGRQRCGADTGVGRVEHAKRCSVSSYGPLTGVGSRRVSQWLLTGAETRALSMSDGAASQLPSLGRSLPADRKSRHAPWHKAKRDTQRPSCLLTGRHVLSVGADGGDSTSASGLTPPPTGHGPFAVSGRCAEADVADDRGTWPIEDDFQGGHLRGGVARDASSSTLTTPSVGGGEAAEESEAVRRAAVGVGEVDARRAVGEAALSTCT